MSLSKWLPCDFEQCHPLLWGGGILVDHWSTISSFVWKSHENMSPCTGSRVNSNYEQIASQVRAQFRMRAWESHRHLLPPTAMSNVSTHWGLLTHICISNLTSIGLDNDLSPFENVVWKMAPTLSRPQCVNHLAMTHLSKTDWHQLKCTTHWTQQQVNTRQKLYSTGLLTTGTGI